MIKQLDHVAIAVDDWEAAVAQYQRLLGSVADVSGTFHARGAKAAVFSLSNSRIVLVPRSCGEVPVPSEVASGLLSSSGVRTGQSEGLAGMCFGAADVEACVSRLQELGLNVEPVEVGDRAGSPRAWALARSVSRGLFVQIVQSSSLPLPAAVGFAQDAVQALDHVVVRSADAERARVLYADALGIRLALDRELHGMRMLFFRTGGVTLEIIADPQLGELDAFYGLAYRVRDIDAAHARLSAAGFEPTAPRPGRKTGTQVFHLQSATYGVPSLIIRDPSRE